MNSSVTQNIFKKMARNRKWVTPYLFIAPTMTLFLAFLMYPMLWSLFLSFHQWRLALGENPTFIGLENYRYLLNDPLFWTAFWNTVYYTVGTVLPGAILALGLALVMNAKFRLRTVFRSIFFFPTIISMVVVALIWQYIFNSDYGIANAFLERIGLPTQKWLADPKMAMPAIIMTSIWKALGYHMVIFLAGLQGIPEVYYEAARVDGASKWNCFRFITLPLLKPIVLFVLVMSVIGSFQVFTQVYVMTGGGPGYATMTLVQYLYDEGFEYYSLGYANSLAYVLFGIILVLTVAQLRFLRTK